MAEQHYDLLIIGAGAAGSTAATTAAQHNARVVMVERDKIGGTCLNYGCDPTKTLLYIAERLYQAQHASRYGLRISSAAITWEEVQAYVRQVINSIRGGTSNEASEELKKNGVEVIQGEARFISPHEVVVTSKQDGQKGSEEHAIFAERIIIASGSETIIPPIEGLNTTGFITNVEAVALPSLPGRLAVVGGGAIGIEFAQMFRRFGVEVTVLEHSPLLLNKEDREVADQLVGLLNKEGIRTETGIELLSVHRAENGKHLKFRTSTKIEEELEVDEILLSIGRKPTLETLNLEAAGVEATKKGITVDAMLRTNVEHIWAAGDITGTYQFTHFAYEQGKVASQNAFAQQPQPFGDRVIPWVTFTDPPLSHVGKTEEELREAGMEYTVGRMQFKDVERAVSQGATDGLVKLLVDTQGKILGGHILGTRADDLLAPIVVAMQAGLPASALASTILPYPTLSEGVRWAADRIEVKNDSKG